MRVLVMGSGAIGGYFGAMLALGGHEVTFVARGATLDALRKRGLEVRTGGHIHRLHPVASVQRPAEAKGPFDLILFTVKGYDTEPSAHALLPAMTADTAVLTLQNGIESAEILSGILGARPVLAGTAYIVATTSAPALINQTSAFRRIVFGEPDGGPSERTEHIATALRESAIEAIVAPDAMAAVWEKFIMQGPHATITSVCQIPIGPILATPAGAALYRSAIAEVAGIARARGIKITDDAEEKAFATISAMPPTARTSMQVDFERGNRVELEQLTGAIAREGAKAGLPAPIATALYAVLAARLNAVGAAT